MPHFERHLFICTNSRSSDHPRGCCLNKGSEEVRAALKQAIAGAGLKDSVRANAAGCLDACEHGVSMVIYPEQTWYGGVTVADVPEIVERHLLRGEVVERLRIPERADLPTKPPTK